MGKFSRDFSTPHLDLAVKGDALNRTTPLYQLFARVYECACGEGLVVKSLAIESNDYDQRMKE